MIEVRPMTEKIIAVILVIAMLILGARKFIQLGIGPLGFLGFLLSIAWFLTLATAIYFVISAFATTFAYVLVSGISGIFLTTWLWLLTAPKIWDFFIDLDDRR
jgi:hypothetical protein